MTRCGVDKIPGISSLVSPKTGNVPIPSFSRSTGSSSAAASSGAVTLRVFLLFFALLLTTDFSSFASDHLFESFSGDLPASARTVFFFDLGKLRTSSFRPAGAEEPAPELLGSLEKKLSMRRLEPEFASGAFFLAGDSAGLLLDSSLSPKQLTEPHRGDDAALAVTETKTPDGHPIFLFYDLRDGKKPDDTLACAFYGQKPGRLLVSAASALPALLQEKTALTPELMSALKHLPENAVLEGVLHPDFSGLPAESVSPLWNGVGRIACAFSWKENDPFPFQGSVLFFPAATGDAERVRRNVSDLVRSAYAAGRERGEIRPEMMFAFQVLPGSGFTELRIRLTGPDAEDFVSLFSSELKKGVFGKCP